MATLKDYAKEAKARLKSGFWQEVNKRRNRDIDQAEWLGKSKDIVLQEYKEVLTRQLFEKESEEDRILYKKVCELLSQNKVVTNPIGMLVDREKMYQLTERAKQQYVLELSRKFKEMKERYYKERGLTLVSKK